MAVRKGSKRTSGAAKAGRGRPRELPEEAVITTVRLLKPSYDAMVDVCFERGQLLSEFIRRAIDAELVKLGRIEAPTYKRR
jgi:hypothetical protein